MGFFSKLLQFFEPTPKVDSAPQIKPGPSPKSKAGLVRKEIDFGRQHISGVESDNADGSSRQTIIKNCKDIYESNDTDILLSFHAVRESHNQNDAKAIYVYAEFSDFDKEGNRKVEKMGTIGYLPEDPAKEIYAKSSYKFEVSVDDYKFYVHNGLVCMSFHVKSYWSDVVITQG